MGYANKRAGYFEGRYKTAPGKYQTVLDEHGKPVRYTTAAAAKKAADRAELQHELSAGGPALAPTASAPMPMASPVAVPVSPPADRLLPTFQEYVNTWIGEQDLARTSRANYASHITLHLLPTFGPLRLNEIDRAKILKWEAEQKRHYDASSVKTYRAVLHVILADAVEEQLITSNPATKKRNRGKKAAPVRVPERVITDALGSLLIAERMALLSGRDDEFVMAVVMYYTGIRLGELRGLEPQYVTRKQIAVEWQLTEVAGRFEKEPPKAGSIRDIHLPSFLGDMLTEFIGRTYREPCACHGLVHVFRGQAKQRSAGRGGRVTQRHLAQHLSLSAATVSAALRGDSNVAPATRDRVQKAAAELNLGATAPGSEAAHLRGSSFRTWLYNPAASGWYPPRGKQNPSRPVPVSAELFPGIPVRGRNAPARADACWLPIAAGMTPHGNRHSHRTLLVELRTPEKLIDARIGHSDGSVQGRYTHVTDDMVAELLDNLTNTWLNALDARLALCPTSPVAILDRLLRARAADLAADGLEVAA
ncbi:LacI family DNA-binding transcriptional regulator [Nocardia cyriacigeorgica]|uniref:LacI family DNA-binding transcriptional regulator n=1 Tax=Nocardia cyriacigeorgica TaxID=135487 RepID=UPI0028051C37|nr:LacI family DNA-binding transcriptional regulator [Nocardia cyriacigeorgica]